MIEINTNVLEIAISFIVIPWTVWASVSIFALKQQLAVLKSELGVLREIKHFLEKGSSCRNFDG